MTSFYNHKPKMNSFYLGLERSAIIDGLMSGYKVIVDRTNISKKICSQFIAIVCGIKELSKEYLKLLDKFEENKFIKHCEQSLIENILVEESRKNTQ